MVVVVGISFNLIIIRVDKGIAVGGNNGTYAETAPSIPLNFRRHPPNHTTTYDLEVSVDVSVSRDVDQDTDHRDLDTVDGGKDSVTVASGDADAKWQAV